MAEAEVEVGRNLREAAVEVATAWKRVESGATVAASDRTFFCDWAALCAVLTPKRFALLKHLRHSPASGVRTLAESLGRDAKRVHADVVALGELGLIVQAEDGGLSSEIDEITSTIRIAA